LSSSLVTAADDDDVIINDVDEYDFTNNIRCLILYWIPKSIVVVPTSSIDVPNSTLLTAS